MRSILLSKSDENYLQKCASELSFSYGIIIGQLIEPDKYIAVHLAKNGEEDVDVPYTQDDSDAHSQLPQRVDDIDTQALTNQWLSACKMIPGSFAVVGIFIAGIDENICEEPTFKTAKRVLNDVRNLLLQGDSFCGNDPMHADCLFLSYSADANKAVCKFFTQPPNGGTFNSMDCRIVEKPFEWHTFECSYELDEIFPIVDVSNKVNIETQFQKAIKSVRTSLAVSEIFLQNESVDDDQLLDMYIKKKMGNRKPQSQQADQDKCIKAAIYLPVKCQLDNDQPIKVRKFNGTIRFSGTISSRIWCNPKNTLGDVKRFVRNDILRSLAARIQVYCDGLTEPNVSNDAIFISEPPRRVYFSLPSGSTEYNPIQFSEYIFRGEAPTVAVAQAKQILDLDINSESIVADLEGLPDDESFSDISSEMETVTANPRSSRDLTRTMYMLGIAVSLLVLLCSILLHYVLHQK